MKLSRGGGRDSDNDEDEDREKNANREEVSSLFHVGERDFSSLRDRHRRSAPLIYSSAPSPL